MSGDSFTQEREKNNIQQINNAARNLDDPFGDGVQHLADWLFEPKSAEHAMSNVVNDFMDAFKQDPKAAAAEWKKIRGDINPGHLDGVKSDIQFIDFVATGKK